MMENVFIILGVMFLVIFIILFIESRIKDED